MTRLHYILKDKIPVAVDLDTWARWFGESNRRVAFTDLHWCSVSTVFLGIDHQWGDGPPLIFETMVFGTDGNEIDDDPMRRYSTWEQAEAGHNEIVVTMRRRGIRVINGG